MVKMSSKGTIHQVLQIATVVFPEQTTASLPVIRVLAYVYALDLKREVQKAFVISPVMNCPFRHGCFQSS